MRNKMNKICSKCSNGIYSKGLCRSHYEKDLRERNPEFARQQREQSLQWRKDHPEWVNDAAKRRREDPLCIERDRLTKKRLALRNVGLTEESSNLLMQRQAGICPVCKRKFQDVGSIHLDHDHITGKARGYLCSRCNNGIGMLDESVNVIQNAILYLQNPPATDFLDMED